MPPQIPPGSAPTAAEIVAARIAEARRGRGQSPASSAVAASTSQGVPAPATASAPAAAVRRPALLPATPQPRQPAKLFPRAAEGASAPEAAQSEASGVPGINVAGTIVRVLYGDAQSRKAMLLVRGKDGRTFKLEGALTFDAAVGTEVSAVAVLERHPKYGDQYRAEFVLEERPTERVPCIDYLARVLEGVGKSLASRLYDEFGAEVYDLLDRDPRRLLAVRGITEAKIDRISESWQAAGVVRNICTFLCRHGVSGAIAARIYSEFGRNSLKVAIETPFELTKVEGFSFQTADKLALECGIRPDSRERIHGAIGAALENVLRQGHTAVPEDVLVRSVLAMTELSADRAAAVRECIAAQVSAKRLVARVIAGAGYLSPKEVAAAEVSIAQSVKRLVESGKPDDRLAEMARQEAEGLKDADQSAAVSNAFGGAVSVITGRPGCGKTTVTRVIAKVAADAGLEVVMCAPTGKAARRTKEATGFDSDTVHSRLRPEQGTLDEFRHGRSNPMAGDLFIIDESTMADTLLAAAFLEAIPSGARVVFVGDVDQLPSVGPGGVLRDLIGSGAVPVARLATIHRTARDSDIVVNAHKIINGDVAGVDLKGKKDFKFYPAVDDHALQKATLERYLEMAEKYGVENVQVLAARRGTAVGVRAINAVIRPVVNPPSPAKPEIDCLGQSLRLGDRVMRTSNSKTASNGEVGVITSVDVEGKQVTVDFGDRKVVHAGRDLFALVHAYATTIHKSQGSEYRGVITLVPPSHRGMLTRNLIYTAVTRGKAESDLIGDAATIRAAVSREGANRCTGLAAELAVVFGGPVPRADSDHCPTSKASFTRPPAASTTTAEPNPSSAAPPLVPPVTGTQSAGRVSLFRRPRP